MTQRLGFLYRDGANFKSYFTAGVQTDVPLQLNQEITYEDLGFTRNRFHEEVIKGSYDAQYDHNFIEVTDILTEAEHLDFENLQYTAKEPHPSLGFITTVLNAIDAGRFTLDSRSRRWRHLWVSCEHLVWERNIMDGWQIDVYSKKQDKHYGRITIDGNLNKTTYTLN